MSPSNRTAHKTNRMLSSVSKGGREALQLGCWSRQRAAKSLN